MSHGGGVVESILWKIDNLIYPPTLSLIADARTGSAVRPPPLNLSSINLNPPPSSEERESNASNSLGATGDYALSLESDRSSKLPFSERDFYSRGAYVDVNVFRYQPGVQGPPENLKVGF